MVVFGTTVLAASTVLSAFMGGLALGSFLFGIVADRSSRPLFVYGLLELGIGLFAFLFPPLVSRAQVVYPMLHRAIGDAYLLFAVFRFLLCFVLLLIPTTLMGGTFPVLIRSCVHERGALGSRIGTLYRLNTLGATIGALVATFVLVEGLGVRGSTYAAAVLNGLIATGAFGLGRRSAANPRREDQAASLPGKISEHRVSPAARLDFEN